MDPLTGLLAIGLYLFGPRPKATQPKPDTRAVAAAQAEADLARAAQARMETELAKARAELAANERAEEQRRTEILTYGQETNEMAGEALSIVPIEHRTAEVELAADMVGRTGVSLASILGQLRPDQRAEMLQLVHGLLSKQAEERAAARRALAEKDAELAKAAQERAVLLKEGELLKAAVETKAADVEVARAERDAKDAELRIENERVIAAVKRASANEGSFWKLCLYAIGAFAWFRLILPALATAFPAFAWLHRVNAFVFHVLTGK